MNSRVGKGLHKTGTLNFATNAVRKLSNSKLRDEER